MGNMNAGLTDCGKIVRESDPDRFLLSLFAPQHRRGALWALFAFNQEIAKTREVVSESTLGLIRLQWWREEIARIYDRGPVSEHEILKPLAEAIRLYELPREHFETLVYAREFDLENVCPGNLEGLLNYCDFTSTPLMKLAVQIAGGEPEMEPVYPVAANYALAGLIRSAGVHASQGRCYLPADLMVKHGIEKEALYGGKPCPGLSAILEEIAAARTGGVKPGLPFLRGVSILSDLYFSYLKGLKYNVLSPRYTLDPPFKALRLAFAIKFMHF